MQVTEDQINAWAKGPSETENEKCENAVGQISDVLRAHFGNDITFIRQGSHRNRTNVKVDSDVDIAVVHNDFYFPNIQNLSESDKALYKAHLKPASYSFAEFKNDVHSLLLNKFGNSVQRKDKCIRVIGNTYRVSADVVPAYEHRRYRSFGIVESTGIEFVCDSGSKDHSFPEQHYANGVKKNDDTGRSYKSVVRILKNVRNQFVDQGKMKLELMPSFFVESLVWNMPLDCFAGSTWREDAEAVTLKIWGDMRNAATANNYAEVSDLLWLFRGQNRTPQQAEAFMLDAWSYIRK